MTKLEPDKENGLTKDSAADSFQVRSVSQERFVKQIGIDPETIMDEIKMSRLIKELKNNRKVVFGSGRFDDWCVYVVEANGISNAPLDVTYFYELNIISLKYPNQKVYNDFVQIYNRTDKFINKDVLTIIDTITCTYEDDDKEKIEQWFTVIYAGMIGEENKANAILKKRIKRLGMYQVLILNMPAAQAAKFSYGKKWRELDQLMRPYGF